MKRTKNKWLIAIATLAVITLAIVLLVQFQNKTKSNSVNESQNIEVENENMEIISEGESLIIFAESISTDATFYKVDIDGTIMEIIAVKDDEGYIKTAFNTCQVCYASGRGYYVQQGNAFVCQNCGSHFTIDDIETKTGGCHPWPIFKEDKIINDDSIEITYDFLRESKDTFAHWKTNY